MPQAPPQTRNWTIGVLAVLTLFFLLGTRSLNEPDEGRYGEIAKEMVETGNWLVPNIWYVPHLDKPPMTYWLVAVSLWLFGFNEWGVRVPLALAGLSGAWATFLLARAIAGQQAARWSVLILVSSLLYFAMARMLTTDIFLTQFVAWAMYFFWRSWRAMDGLKSEDEEIRGAAGKKSVVWQLAAWIAMAGGFLTKGPIILLVALPPVVALAIWRRGDAVRTNISIFGAVVGLTAFCALAFPWFLTIFEVLPGSFDFMVKGQVVAHAAGAETKGRHAPFFYFFGILAVGFLPWTVLLGRLWRKAHWQELSATDREAWVFLNVWAILTFVFFSINSAKLPAYILPIFPALAIMLAWRWFSEDARFDRLGLAVWRSVLLSPILPMLAFPLVYYFEFKVRQPWLWIQVAGTAVAGVVLWVASKRWTGIQCARGAVAAALIHLGLLVALVPKVETELKSNQTLKPIAVAIKREYRNGDLIAAWGRLPQGLPFYGYPVINATNRPYMGGMPKHRLPFEFPGNEARLGELLLKDEQAFAELLQGKRKVFVVGFRGTFAQASAWAKEARLRLVVEAGQWELITNDGK